MSTARAEKSSVGRSPRPGRDRANPDILVLEDDLDVCRLFERLALMQGWTVRCVDSVSRFVEALHTSRPTLLVVDLKLRRGFGDGMEVFSHLAETQCQTPVLIVSGYDLRVLKSASQLAETMGVSVVASVSKPFDLDRLTKLMAQAVDEPGSQASLFKVDALTELKHGLRRGELTPYFLPKVDLLTDRVVGVEALARWRHPRRGLLEPVEFLDMIEQHALASELTSVMLEGSLQAHGLWRAQGLDLGVAVNISPAEFDDRHLPERLDSILLRHHFPRGRLTLEITERNVCPDASLMVEILNRLRLREIDLSFDDIGTGHATLAQLQRLPVSEVKISDYFVRSFLSDPDCAAFVEAIVQVSHTLNLRVVAEGVESQAALARLRELGVDHAQGFGISPPLPADEIAQWIARGPWTT